MATNEAPPSPPRELETAPESAHMREIRRWRAGRRTFVAALALVVLAGLATLLGPRTAATTAEGGGYLLTVRYPAVTRPGLAVQLAVVVQRPGGFDGPVTLTVRDEYIDMFDENGLDPDPAAATQEPGRVIWSFDPPPGDTLLVTYDARTEPAVQWMRRGRVTVRAGGRDVVAVEFRTWVMP